MYQGKVLLSDLDGTLLNSNRAISTENMEAIQYFVDNGGKFGVATGRDVENALNLLTEVPINFYCIFSNGSVLYNRKEAKVLGEHALEKEKVLPFLEKCIKERPDIGIEVHTNEGTVLCPAEGCVDLSLISSHHPFCYKTLEELSACTLRKLLFVTKDGDFTWLEEQAKMLSSVIEGVQSSKIFYEFLPLGSSKGSMVKEIRPMMEKGDMLYAVGDFYNDKEMIVESDVGILCENAPEELKKLAKYTCASNNNHAVADVIRRIIPSDK